MVNASIRHISNLKGDPGMRGKPGEKGDTGTLDFADASSVAAGDPATVRIVTDGRGTGAEFDIPRGLPGADAVPADEAVASYIRATDAQSHSATNYAIENFPHSFTEPQTFDSEGGFTVGDVNVSYVSGWFGQRLHVTGTDPGVMPYIEVVPTALTSTDTGKRLAGYQLYRSLGGGSVDDREFLAIEAVSDENPNPGFVFQTWASGSGEVMPMIFRGGANEAFRVTPSGQIQLGSGGYLFADRQSRQTPYISRKDGPLIPVQSRVYSNAGVTSPIIQLAANRGTVDVPENRQQGDALGRIWFGTMDGSTFVDGAAIVATAAEDLAPTSAMGTTLTMQTGIPGTTVVGNMLQVNDSGSHADTALLIRVNRNGTKSMNRVTVGAPDSAGSGYRELRVEN